MKLELLYPEVCNLYGDLMNATYLQKALPEAELIRTRLKETPAFARGEADMVILCSMTEKAQELVAAALEPYKEQLLAQMDKGTVFLITGNAMEVFFRYIEKEDGTRIPMLGLFDLYAKREMTKRYNALYLGSFQGADIVGFKSQFSHSYGDGPGPLFETLRGAGRNPTVAPEGIRYHNFMASYLLGPLLILNPPFTKYILGLLGAAGRPLPFEEAAMDSYTLRCAEFKDPKRGFVYH